MLKKELEVQCVELIKTNTHLQNEADKQQRIIKDKSNELDNAEREIVQLKNRLRTLYCRADTVLKVLYPVSHTPLHEVSLKQVEDGYPLTNEETHSSDEFKNFLKVVIDETYSDSVHNIITDVFSHKRF